jgi:hypothetical protein
MLIENGSSSSSDPSSSNSNNGNNNNNSDDFDSSRVPETDALTRAQNALKDRMEKLQEVDLRQLGSVVYKKVIANRQSIDGLDGAPTGEGVLDFSRRRKQRIVMVS